VDCTECGASGLMAGPLKGERRGLLRRLVGKVKTLAGRGDTAGGVASDAAFMLSNRCRRCHGLGRVPCSACGGLGVRATVRRPGDLKQ
jgi:DnaJ-class molecular chaperone